MCRLHNNEIDYTVPIPLEGCLAKKIRNKKKILYKQYYNYHLVSLCKKNNTNKNKSTLVRVMHKFSNEMLC